VPEETDDLSREEQALRQLRNQRLRRQRQRQMLAWVKEEKTRWETLTGPLKRPRKEYVDALGATGLALCEVREINRAMKDGKLAFEQPAPLRKYILKSELRAWMEATGRD
jgi:hypothetical protein